MGTPRLCLCGGSSTEQILQTVHSPPALSLLRHIVCALAFHSGWGEDCSQSHWANSGERSLPSLLCSQENLPLFLFFFISAPSCRAESLMSESWINCFKPEGRATHHQTLPEMFYWRLLKLSHYTRWTNIGQQKAPNSVFSLLFMVSNHFREKLWMFCLLLVSSVSGLRLKIILVVSFFQRKSGTQETKHGGRGQHWGLAGAHVLFVDPAFHLPLMLQNWRIWYVVLYGYHRLPSSETFHQSINWKHYMAFNFLFRHSSKMTITA